MGCGLRTDEPSKWSPNLDRWLRSAPLTPLALTRVAWRPGNRHLPTEILPKALRIRRDPAIEAMAEGLGARVIALEAPFNPEGCAYVKSNRGADSHHHGNDHDHGRVDAHAHHHDHDHDRRRG